jgi:hypothetical protein
MVVRDIANVETPGRYRVAAHKPLARDRRYRAPLYNAHHAVRIVADTVYNFW